MHKFIVLCTFGADGRAALPRGEHDLEALAQSVAGSLHTRVDQLYLTTGTVDAVVVLEGQLQDALSFAMAFGGAVGATTHTLAADDSVSNVLRAATLAHTRVIADQPGGGG